MNDVGSLSARSCHGVSVPDVGEDELEVRMIFQRLEVLAFTLGQVVDDDDPMAFREKAPREIRADEAGSSCNNNRRHFLIQIAAAESSRRVSAGSSVRRDDSI
jgi:hypothetical protein